MTRRWFPFGVAPLLVLHVATPIGSFSKTKNVRMGVIVQLLHMWFHPCFNIVHLSKGMSATVVRLCSTNSLKKIWERRNKQLQLHVMAWKPSYRDISGPSLGFSDVPTRILVLKNNSPGRVSASCFLSHMLTWPNSASISSWVWPTMRKPSSICTRK